MHNTFKKYQTVYITYFTAKNQTNRRLSRCCAHRFSKRLARAPLKLLSGSTRMFWRAPLKLLSGSTQTVVGLHSNYCQAPLKLLTGSTQTIVGSTQTIVELHSNVLAGSTQTVGGLHSNCWRAPLKVTYSLKCL